jgi:hypothetical protein
MTPPFRWVFAPPDLCYSTTRNRRCVASGISITLSIHLVPVLLGGTRMFELLGREHIQLETVISSMSPALMCTAARYPHGILLW